MRRLLRGVILELGAQRAFRLGGGRADAAASAVTAWRYWPEYPASSSRVSSPRDQRV